MQNKKNTEDNSQKVTNFILTFLSGFIQKISIGLILNAKKQVDEIILQIKRGVIAGFFTLFGIFFLLIGLAIYLGSVLEFIPGSGYFAVGSASLLIAFLIVLIKK